MNLVSDIKRRVILISTLYSSSMILYSVLPRYLIMVIAFLHLIIVISLLKKLFKIKETLFITSICLLPTSFVSLIATSTSRFPFSWFHIITILLFLIICASGKMNQVYFMLLTTFLTFGCISSLFVPLFSDAIKQVLTIFLFLVSFIIGESFVGNTNQNFKLFSADMLLYSCISFGLQIIIQRGVVMTHGIDVGHHIAMGQGRIAYAGLMGDYSFATLYLAVGCMLTLVYYLDYKKISVIQFILYELFLVFSILCVTSRTGLVAFTIILVIYLLRHANRINNKIIFIIISSCVMIPYIITRLVSVRGNQSLVDSSGRLEQYIEALSYFEQNPFLGVGFGLSNLKMATGFGVPHNFFVQYLLQIGILGTLIIIVFFVVYLKKYYWKSDPLKWLFWLVVIGAMFIPDIASSRFFGVVIIITMIGDKNTYENEASRETRIQNEKGI